MMMLEQMRVARLVEKLGGPTYIERKIGARSVKMWRQDGRVPYRWRHPLKELAALDGVELLKVELKLLELR